jgi:hypothetical protein
MGTQALDGPGRQVEPVLAGEVQDGPDADVAVQVAVELDQG